MAFCAKSERADMSNSAKFIDSNLAPWSSFQMHHSPEVLKTYGPIQGICFLSSQGLLDLQVTKAA